jgi:hypothetical protein
MPSTKAFWNPTCTLESVLIQEGRLQAPGTDIRTPFSRAGAGYAKISATHPLEVR